MSCKSSGGGSGCGLAYIENLGSQFTIGTCGGLSSSSRSLEKGGDGLGLGTSCHGATRAGSLPRLARGTSLATRVCQAEVQSHSGLFSHKEDWENLWSGQQLHFPLCGQNSKKNSQSERETTNTHVTLCAVLNAVRILPRFILTTALFSSLVQIRKLRHRAVKLPQIT